jgi:hypothetical protein
VALETIFGIRNGFFRLGFVGFPVGQMGFPADVIGKVREKKEKRKRKKPDLGVKATTTLLQGKHCRNRIKAVEGQPPATKIPQTRSIHFNIRGLKPTENNNKAKKTTTKKLQQKAKHT